MRILQVTNGFPPTATAGTEQYTHQLSRGLSTCHDVMVFCRESALDRADYDLLDGHFDGVQVRRVVNDFQHASRIQDFYLDRRIESIFEKTLRDWKPDLVHFQHCLGLSARLLEVADRAGLPFLLTLHDYWFLCSRIHLLHRQGHICPGPIDGVDCRDCTASPNDLLGALKGTWLYRLARSHLNDYSKRFVLSALSRLTPRRPVLRREQVRSPFREREHNMLSLLANTPLILTPSRFVKDLYARHGVPESRIQVMPLGLDKTPWCTTNLSQPHPADGLRVGYLGSLLQHKGADVLVRAFRRLQAPGATLEIHGFAVPADPYIGKFGRLVRKDPRVKLRGRYRREHLPTILGRLDLIVIPSLWHETFSIVAREALLSGTPVVASEVGALSEVIEHERNGLLVPAGDVDALQHALHRLSTDPVLLAHLRDGARRSTSDIKSMEEHILDLEQIYRALAA